MTKNTIKTHVDEPIDSRKELSGNSRKAGDAPPEIQQKVIDLIIEEARNRRFNNRDIAYYIAIAKRESGFNPDAANSNSTASGIAQVVDNTGKTYHIDDSNRFNARASIQAGLDYFAKIKSTVIADFGSADGPYEPLIYYCYHYGEFSTHRREVIKGKVTVKEASPLGELTANHKYADSKTVVDDAIRIEKILNDSHALKVQLTDILGRPMTGRKVIVVKKKAKVADSPSPAPDTTPAAGTAKEHETTNSPEAVSPQKTSEDETQHTTLSADCGPPAKFPEEWDLVAYEVTTDSEGNVPEIESETQEPFVILIPRIDYDAYNEAVSKQLMCEYGNKHDILARDGEEGALPTIKTQDKEEEKKPAPEIQKKKPEAPPPPKPPATILDAAKESNGKPSSPPSPGPDISFEDVVAALKKDLGWKNVYETSFAYIKQFYTRPRLPAAPLSQDTKIKKSPARVQAIGSSMQNKETKTATVKDKVTTATETAIKEVKVAGDAPWMTHAIQEQNKSGSEKVKEEPGTHRSDAKWKEKYKTRTEAEKAIKSAQGDLKREAHKPEKSRDAKKISELQQKVKEQEAIRDQADQDMQEIEKEYNNKDIVKYLQSTSLSKDAARDDATAWCSSFANWCIEQAGYHGTGNAAAESWLHWGEKIDEPKYGAITITTRASNPVKYHVGFFIGIGHDQIVDGEEEVEVKGKNGEITKRKKKKHRDVETVRLLSGNYSSQVREGHEWTVLAKDNPVKHLVSYRWPTAKEKK